MAESTSVLNDLIETSKDGEKGFRTAADEAKDPELKRIFLERAEDCAKGAAQLQKIVARYGDKPETGGSVAGALHRGWVNLKSKVTDRDDAALEDSSLDPDVRSTVQRQYDGVLRNHDQIRALRDRYRAARP